MDSLNVFFDMIVLAYGIYSLYTWFKIKGLGTLPEKCFLIPQNHSLADCFDPEGYVAAMTPRLLVFSVIITLFGAFGLANTYFGLLNSLTQGMSLGAAIAIELGGTTAIPVVTLFWFAIILRKYQKQAWDC